MNLIKKLVAITTIFLLLIVVNLYSQNNTIEVAPAKILTPNNDTIPSKMEKDIDKLEIELKSIWNNVEENFKKLDWTNLQKQINKSIEKINFDSSFKKAQNYINNIDIKKFAKKLQNSEEWKTMETDLQKTLSELKNMDEQKLQKEINKLKIKISEAQQQKLKNNLNTIQPILQQKIKELQKEIEILKQNTESKKTNHYTFVPSSFNSFEEILINTAI